MCIIDNLEQICHHCSGNKRVEKHFQNSEGTYFYRCEMCRGRGKIITQAGMEFFEFMDFYVYWNNSIRELKVDIENLKDVNRNCNGY